MVEKKIKQILIEKRAMHYNDFAACIKQLKKKIVDIETRVTKEGDSINFSANSEILEDAAMLWKASHRLYQIDDLLEALRDDTQKLSVSPQNVPETHEINKRVDQHTKKT